MTIMPQLPYSSRVQQTTQIDFGGLHAGENCRDGQWKRMVNMSIADLPVMRTRQRRYVAPWTATDAVAAMVNDRGMAVYISSNGQVTMRNLETGHGVVPLAEPGTVDASWQTKLVRFGNRAMVMPDGLLLNINYRIRGFVISVSSVPLEGREKGDAWIVPSLHVMLWDGREWLDKGPAVQRVQQTLDAESVTFCHGTLFGEEAEANTLIIGEDDLTEVFRVGDAVEISGCSQIPSNNRIPIIREIDGNKLRFTANTFTLPEGEDSYTEVQQTVAGEPVPIRVQRRWPELDFAFEHGNRLWGAKGKTIYCSKLGDPLSWYVLGDGLSTDAWQLETQSDGELTGGISFSGYPTFFKPNCSIMIYGSNAGNFSTREIAMPGSRKGMNGLTQIAGGQLIYQSGQAMMIYASEGYPDVQRDEIGMVSSDEIDLAASTGNEYIGLIDANGGDGIYCWNAERMAWAAEDAWEDDHDILDIFQTGDKVFLLRTGGVVEQIRGEPMQGWTQEGNFRSELETGDMNGNAANHKWITRVLIRVTVEPGGKLELDVSHDGGPWIRTGIIDNKDGKKTNSWYFPVRPNRCDTFRIRFRGEGEWMLRSMAIEKRIGTALH